MTEMWVGAVVVTDDSRCPQTLVSGGEDDWRMITPIARLDGGVSALDVAASAAATAAAVTNVGYAGYLGEWRGDAGGRRSVAWYLFGVPRAAAVEHPGSSRWVAWDNVVRDGDQLPPHVCRAQDLVGGRRSTGLRFSSTLDALLRRCSRTAGDLLHDVDDAGLGLCGSAARGDFVDGWSDVDLLAWGLQPASPVGQSLEALVAELERGYGVRTSLDFTDGNGEDPVDADPLVTPKLQGLLLRGTTEMLVLAGCPPPVPSDLRLSDGLDGSIDRLHRFVVRHLGSDASSPHQRAERTRKALSVGCHAARSVSTALDPLSPKDLASVASQLRHRWPDNDMSRLLLAYRQLRQSGADDLTRAEVLAARVPEALTGLRELIVSSGIVTPADP